MPVVARDLLDGGAPTYGLLLGGFGIGAMVGALFSATLRRGFRATGCCGSSPRWRSSPC